MLSLLSFKGKSEGSDLVVDEPQVRNLQLAVQHVKNLQVDAPSVRNLELAAQHV